MNLDSWDLRILVTRPFVSAVTGEDTTDVAKAAMRLGLEEPLLEVYNEVSRGWVQDAMTMIFREARRYLCDMGSVVPIGVLANKLQNNYPKEVAAIGEAVGGLKVHPVPGMPDLVHAISALQDIRDTLKLRAVWESSMLALTSGKASVSDISDTVMSSVREVRARRAAGVMQATTPLYMSFRDTLEDRAARYLGKDPGGKRARTGIARVDAETGGGLRPGSLMLIQAPPNTGKSRLLQHIAMTTMYDGGTVVLASGEMSPDENFERIDGTVLLQDYLDLTRDGRSSFLRSADVARLKKRVKSHVKGELIVIPPVHCRTTADIRESLVDISRSYTPTILLVDYLTLVAPVNVSASTESHVRFAQTAIELKQLGADFDIPTVTGAQTKRGATKEHESMDNTAFSYAINHNVDLGLEARYDSEVVERAAETGEALEVERELRLSCIKHRGGKVGWRERLLVNFATGEIRSMDVVEQERQEAMVRAVLESVSPDKLSRAVWDEQNQVLYDPRTGVVLDSGGEEYGDL